jgi:hypothetical protein
MAWENPTMAFGGVTGLSCTSAGRTNMSCGRDGSQALYSAKS